MHTISATYTSRQACEITGLTSRQLAYWRKSGVISPTEYTPGGHARYAFPDLVALKAAKQLLDSGVSLQKVRKNLSALLDHLPTLERPLSEVSLVAAGDIVLILHEQHAFEAISGQQWIFPIARLQKDIERYAARDDERSPVQRELFPKPARGDLKETAYIAASR